MTRTRSIFFILTAALFLGQAAFAGGQAILWIPSGDAGIDGILTILEENADLRLTAALAPQTKDFGSRIRKLAEDGRLELTQRPAGDPPLPLLYYPGTDEVRWEGKPSEFPSPSAASYFLSLRLGMARDAAAKEYGKAPEGLVSPPGGLASDYFPLARALGIKWIASGPLASTAAVVMESGGVYAVPFVEFSTSTPSYDAPAFIVFDETSSGDPAALREQLAAELQAPALYRRVTVSEGLAASVSTSAASAEISAAASPWSGDYSRWASAPLQSGALAALARTRTDLMIHLNSEQGNFLQAEPAFLEYFSAEVGEKLLVLTSTSASAEAELDLRNTLANVYRLMNKPPPPWAYSSLADAASADAQEDSIASSLIPGGFELTNVSRPAVLPQNTAVLPASADPARIWKLAGLKVSAGTDGILFQFKPAALDNSLKSDSGFSHILLDLYIDVNHRPRAGISMPLDGRPLRLFPENAWEYALEVSPEGASFYKATPRGAAAAGKFKAYAEGGWIKVLVPRSFLRGTPELWSYAALMLAPGEGSYVITDFIADKISKGYVYAVRPSR
jgi:hypothetical protein